MTKPLTPTDLTTFRARAARGRSLPPWETLRLLDALGDAKEQAWRWFRAGFFKSHEGWNGEWPGQHEWSGHDEEDLHDAFDEAWAAALKGATNEQ